MHLGLSEGVLGCPVGPWGSWGVAVGPWVVPWLPCGYMGGSSGSLGFPRGCHFQKRSVDAADQESWLPFNDLSLVDV